jgi:HAD superfamily hydrolase (TIGR01484 family)
MPPLFATCPTPRLRAVRGVLTDIDDTLTRDGAIEPPALAALQALRAAGLHVLAITGRPAGWSAPFARDWPLDAIVAENGAVALIHAPDAPDGLRWAYAQDEATRARHTQRLAAAQAAVRAAVPDAVVAADSPGRVTDIAFDHSEDVQRDAAHIERVAEAMRAQGLTVTVSSIHVNGWYGPHDKLSGARWMLRELYGADLDAELDRWVYVGDSTNDQVMFGHFPLAVGVANLLHFADQLHTWPAWLTAGERGAGFAEVAQALLDARRTP